MSTPTKAAAAAAASKYVVARGVIVTLNSKTKKTAEIGEGQPFTPADDDEAASLLAAGSIMTAEDFAAKVGGSSVTSALAAANARADAAADQAAEATARAAAAEAELAKLKAAPPAAPNPAQ